MKVALVGYALEGQSALAYWQQQGAEVTICDRDEQKEVPVSVHARLGEHYLDNLDEFDIIVRTAGINPHIILDKNPGIADKVTTVINEFMRVCPTKNVIGVTGTKGKGTTSTLIASMLEAAGKDVHLGGNIGLSPFDFLPQLTSDSWVVLELSSFQLIDLKYSPHIALCLMVVPEHLNWHLDMEDYVRAKSQLFAHQAAADTAIYFADSKISHLIASTSPGRKLAYYDEPGAYVTEDGVITIDTQTICKTDDLKLLGRHNWQNACAAATVVWQVVQSVDPIRRVLTTFTGLPHRLEFVRELDGVSYYDDSFGTTPETAIVAMKAFNQPKIVILGGASKGAMFDNLAKAVTESNVRHVITIGDTGPVIADELKAGGFTNITPGGTSMQQIVDTARDHAKSGDIVLLSTGCASFGLFSDYKDRGNQFKTVVNELT